MTFFPFPQSPFPPATSPTCTLVAGADPVLAAGDLTPGLQATQDQGASSRPGERRPGPMLHSRLACPLHCRGLALGSLAGWEQLFPHPWAQPLESFGVSPRVSPRASGREGEQGEGDGDPLGSPSVHFPSQGLLTVTPGRKSICSNSVRPNSETRCKGGPCLLGALRLAGAGRGQDVPGQGSLCCSVWGMLYGENPVAKTWKWHWEGGCCGLNCDPIHTLKLECPLPHGYIWRKEVLKVN